MIIIIYQYNLLQFLDKPWPGIPGSGTAWDKHVQGMSCALLISWLLRWKNTAISRKKQQGLTGKQPTDVDVEGVNKELQLLGLQGPHFSIPFLVVHL